MSHLASAGIPSTKNQDSHTIGLKHFAEYNYILSSKLNNHFVKIRINNTSNQGGMQKI